MKIRIKKYFGEYEVSVLYNNHVILSWNLVMDMDGEYESEEMQPYEQDNL